MGGDANSPASQCRDQSCEPCIHRLFTEAVQCCKAKPEETVAALSRAVLEGIDSAFVTLRPSSWSCLLPLIDEGSPQVSMNCLRTAKTLLLGVRSRHIGAAPAYAVMSMVIRWPGHVSMRHCGRRQAPLGGLTVSQRCVASRFSACRAYDGRRALGLALSVLSTCTCQAQRHSSRSTHCSRISPAHHGYSAGRVWSRLRVAWRALRRPR